jgi:hypothetical protein
MLKIAVKLTSCIALTGLLVSLSGCERYALDRQMEELCKKDGGVKVYETVTLSQTQYQRVLSFVVQTPLDEEDYYGPEFRYVSERQYLHGKDGDAQKGKGELVRWYSALYRARDNKLLGEAVWYARKGGDLTTFPFGPTDNACQKNRQDLGLSVFVKGSSE